MTNDAVYQRVLDQLLFAGLGFAEASRLARAQADEVAPADTFEPLGAAASRVVRGLTARTADALGAEVQELAAHASLCAQQIRRGK